MAKIVRETLQRPTPVHGKEIHLCELTPVEFERLIHDYLSQIYGKEVNVTMRGFDWHFPADIQLVDPDPIWGGKVVVVAKRYSPNHKITSSEVLSVIGAVANTGSSQGVIFTTGKLSEAAIDLAESHRVRLVDGALLVELLQQQGFNATLT